MKVKVELDKCIGAGTCVMSSPDVFDQRDEDGLVVVLEESPDDSLMESVHSAVAACPAGAIAVVA